MPFKTKSQKVTLLLLVIVIISGFYIYTAQKSDHKEEVIGLATPLQQEKPVTKIELKGEQGEVPETPQSSKKNYDLTPTKRNTNKGKNHRQTTCESQ